MSCICVRIDRVDKIGARADRVDRISIGISLVCDTGIRRYLRVTPTFLWVTTEEMNEDVEVKSNTDWKVD